MDGMERWVYGLIGEEDGVHASTLSFPGRGVLKRANMRST